MKIQELEKEVTKTKMRGIWMTIYFIGCLAGMISCLYFTLQYGERSIIPYLSVIIAFFCGWRMLRLWNINKQKMGSFIKNIQK
jgi:hypothetical protein